VYYHILKGSKVFWFIRPTKNNLDAYAKWSDSSNQDDKVTKIVLNPGDTMIIPSGVIHAVVSAD
jgi:mannose-6-phosphate isomerase class I